MKFFILAATFFLALQKPVSAQTYALTSQAAAVNNVKYNNLGSSDSLFGSVRILPIPSSGQIVVFINAATPNGFSEGDMVVYNSAGQPFAKAHFTTGTNNIFVNNMASGMYFLRLLPKNGPPAVQQFVVAR